MKPRLLLVEDDPVSRDFLRMASEALPAQVDAVATAAEAVRITAAGAHALWLIDANLPDGSGTDLLATLRGIDPATPALLHTAGCSDDRRRSLLAAGFVAVVTKPIGVTDWQAVLRAALAMPASDATPANPAVTDTRLRMPLWDQAQASRALGGKTQHIDGLRTLFLAELPGQLDALRDGDAASRRDLLHRLRASCGFVGAARLDAAVRALQASPEDHALLQAVLAAGRETLDQPPSS